MLKEIVGFFSGGTMKSIENIASEWIETGSEKAEAAALMIKTLDPNGLMRRDLSRRVAMLYTVYIFTMLFMIILEFTCAFFGWDVDSKAIAVATSKAVELFLPITTLFGTIVGASFGVNAYNVKKGN